ncbi:hypothetical protein QG37_05350 [Candidozyma auris]|uniref:Uncharacterized protein n=1 Tax=Candidozyma auris TaxID=498019 RepID=A0A0L0NV20_CANAR|nr:hypothetical protein QG37_05350 [[Candida] auris]
MDVEDETNQQQNKVIGPRIFGELLFPDVDKLLLIF